MNTQAEQHADATLDAHKRLERFGPNADLSVLSWRVTDAQNRYVLIDEERSGWFRLTYYRSHDDGESTTFELETFASLDELLSYLDTGTKPYSFTLDGYDDFPMIHGDNMRYWNGWGCPILEASEVVKLQAFVDTLPADDDSEVLQTMIDESGKTDDGRIALGDGICWYVEALYI